ARPGRYRVKIDLVHEHVRWFDCGISAEVDVVPVRRVAIIGQPAPVLAAFESAPELEPVLVQPGAAVPSTGDDFEYAPGLRSYLLDAAPARGIPLALTAARRTVSLLRIARSAQSGRPLRTLPRGGTDFLESLARC